MSRPLALTELALRDAHQSLLATRLRIEDMLPIAQQLDAVGFWSLETWGGATFDACIRFLGEDPWERLRQLKQAMPKTPHQMLLRGQNLLGYRHYADDVVYRFVERAKVTGIDVFRIFDALNDVRNLKIPIKAALAMQGHVQGTLSYTTSPVHSLTTWVDLARQLEDEGCHSLCIKDMSGLLRPEEGYQLISTLKQTVQIPIALHCHATTGLSLLTQMKAIEADVDIIDTAISSLSMTYGHSPTETLVAGVAHTPRDTGLNLSLLEEIATYFREVRKKYVDFEGQLKGVDARILTAQVPGGMLTNMENQLKEQQALERMDEVLQEIPCVRKDLGYLPLVTPASQIVGTQAVLNVLSRERYQTVTKETTSLLKGEYGQTPAPVNPDLQKRVLGDQQPIKHRPADDLLPELNTLEQSLKEKARSANFTLSNPIIDDVLTYALFPQISLHFFKNRNNPHAFEAKPKTSVKTKASQLDTHQTTSTQGEKNAVYQVRVNGQTFKVEVDVSNNSDNTQTTNTISTQQDITSGSEIKAPLSGQIFQIKTQTGAHVQAGDVVAVLEAMKMETEIRTPTTGQVQEIYVQPGDQVVVGAPILRIK